MPTAEGAVAVPTSIALPAAGSSLVPLKGDPYEERPSPATHSTKLMPLYHNRGYYGPQPNADADEQEYDIVSPSDHPPRYIPTAFSAPSAPAATYPPKRVKVIKVKDAPPRKAKSKVRKPKRPVSEAPLVDEEAPVSTFHEQFYSDVDGAGTVKKIRKPKRVEKIIDGNTEHIHTYSEEHIHKVVYDDPKYGGVGPSASMSGHAPHSLLPLRNHHLLSLAEQDPYSRPAYGSLGTPSHMEFAAYNPREVTHDHIFHDHGEIPPNVDLTKDSLNLPPKASFTANGLKIAEYKRPVSKPKFHGNRNSKPTRPPPQTIDFSYYENIYTATGRPKPHRQPASYSDYSTESNVDHFRPIPAFRFKDTKPKSVENNPYYGHAVGNPSNVYQLRLPSQPSPFSAASQHDYAGTGFAGSKPATAGFSNFKDPFSSYKGSYSNNYDHDSTFASSSNAEPSNWNSQDQRDKKKKSISTQNVKFGGRDLKTIVDHLAEASELQPVIKENTADNAQYEEQGAPTTHYTITEKSPLYDYYSNMALKAFQEHTAVSMPEASNNNYQFAVAPGTSPAPSLVTPAESTTPAPTASAPARTKRRRQRNKPSRPTEETRPPLDEPTPTSLRLRPAAHAQGFKRTRTATPPPSYVDHTDDSPRPTYKYGDKI